MTITITSPFIQRTCPSCGEESSLARSSKIRAEAEPLENLNNYWSGFFKDRIFFSYHRCKNCTLLYCGTYFSQAQLGKMYSSMSDNTAGQPLALMESTQLGYFKLLLKNGECQGRYVEIGPDIGLFTALAAKTGKITDFNLWEPNQAVHPQIQNAVGTIPSRIHADLTTLEDLVDHSIDVVIMIHVLDHLLEPLPFLKLLRRKMSDNSHICIVTHNEKSILARILGNRWPAFCLQHPQLFNPKSIRGLLQAAGFSTKGVYRTTNYFPAMYLIKHALWSCGLKLKIPEWNFPILPMKLGNIETIGIASLEKP